MPICIVWAINLCFVLLVRASAQDSFQSPSDAQQSSPLPFSGISIGDNSGLNLDMKLEDLTRQAVVVPALSTPVTTAERQPSTIGHTPAAVFVITPEMIRRSGARNLPDVLRMAPGVDVARINAYTWAISIRGFNSRFANKTLVQIDGRVVYNAIFGGVYWDQQDVLLEDVERIEVIRGPGTTMWGSNAVNGVINIITKKSSDTQRLLEQSGGGGQDQRDFNSVRYGGGNGQGLTWRVWGQQTDPAAGFSNIGEDDAWHLQHGGFRMDYAPDCEQTFTLQGDMLNGFGGYTGRSSFLTPPFSALVSDTATFPEGNILLRYERKLDAQTSWQVLAYYDHFDQNIPTEVNVLADTYDIDLQYQFSPWDGHQFVAGANYRNSQDVTHGTFVVKFVPYCFDTQWGGVFVQDTMALEEDRCYLTLGIRGEVNTFGGFQPEPTARILFLPSDRQSLWVAVSRAARNPTLKDTDLDVHTNIQPGQPVFLNILGNPDLQAENLVAYEIGYRAAPTDRFTWDIAGYLNDYDNLVGQGPVVLPPPGPPPVILTTTSENNTRAISYGFETTATYQVSDRWKWFTSYSLFEVHAAGADPASIADIEGSSPHNQIYLRSSWDFAPNVQWDLIGRYVDSLTAENVPAYFELDTRIGWQLSRRMEVSIVGQNLLNGHHLEFIDPVSSLISTQVNRSWYGMLTWRF